MKIRKFVCYAFIVFLILYVLLYVFRTPMYGAANDYSSGEKSINRHQGLDLKADYRESNSSDLLKWDIDVDNKVFQISVNTYDETIIVQGQAENWQQEEKVKKIVTMRAPTNYRIIYQISVNDSDKG